MWNNTLGTLWRYTTIYLRRALAHEDRITEAELRRLVRPAFSKVTEYQKRGLVRVHVLGRLDRAMPKYREEEVHPPPRRFTAELFEHAFRAAATAVSAPVDENMGGGRVRWGEMVDIRQLATGEQRRQLAGYLAKYSTKSTELAGGLLHRIEPAHVEDVDVREHVRGYMRAAFDLDATVSRARAKARQQHRPRALDVETDWNPVALASRVRRAMSRASVCGSASMTAPCRPGT